MAMATATASLMMMLAAAMLSLTTTFTIVAATAASLSTQMVEQVLDFLCGSIAVFEDSTNKLKRLAGQWVIGIYGYVVFCHLDDASHEAVLLLVHQCDDGTFKDMLMVEMTINGEVLTFHLVHTLLIINAKSFFRGYREVKLLAWLQLDNMLLESIERHAKATDEYKRSALLSLLNQGLLVSFYRVELIAHRQELVGCFFHFLLFCL